MSASHRDRVVVSRIEAWFAQNARRLPWRTTPRDPYVSFVAEIMLQQTQALRVAERLPEFLLRFPTFEALAQASDDAVLAVWSGLGYYSRALRLRNAARMVVEEHGGSLPDDHAALRALPGVGAYTAGALLSLVHNQRTPLVDANVERVLARLEGWPWPRGSAELRAAAWRRAEELVNRAHSPSLFNEGVMELGAVHCAPRSPACSDCPLASLCSARRAKRVEAVPPPGRRPGKRVETHLCLLLCDRQGRWLVERRAEQGLWAGMWQPPTLHAAEGRSDRGALQRLVPHAQLRKLGDFRRETSSCTVRFSLWTAEPLSAQALKPLLTGKRRLVSPRQLQRLALASPHRKAFALAGAIPEIRRPAGRAGALPRSDA